MMLLQIALPLLGLILFPPIEVPIEKTYHSAQQESVACSCSGYAHTLRPDLIPLVNARDLVPNAEHPTAGGAVLFYYPASNLHHVGIVVWTDGEYMEVVEANFSPCEITSRVIPIDEKRVIGFIN